MAFTLAGYRMFDYVSKRDNTKHSGVTLYLAYQAGEVKGCVGNAFLTNRDGKLPYCSVEVFNRSGLSENDIGSGVDLLYNQWGNVADIVKV